MWRQATLGVVYLVGAGPGDPGLVTVQAARLLANADVVICDDGVGDGIRGLIGAGAEVVTVRGGGSRRGGEPDRAVSLMIEAAARAESVVRLYAGDAFLFGDVGSEARALGASGISCELVPGVPAALAAPVVAGYPITSDSAADTVVLTSPDPGAAGGVAAPSWEVSSIGAGTLLIQSHTMALAAVVERLLRHGWAPDAELCVIERPGATSQRSMVSPLMDVAAHVERCGWNGPLLVMAGASVERGRVVQGGEWRPLKGLRIVVTRARAQAAELVEALESLGAEVLSFPTIRIEDPADPGPLLEAARSLDSYDWVVFTSANAVERFWRALESVGRDARAFGGARVACIGPATAAALGRCGIRADLIPPTHVAESVLEALIEVADVRGARILLPRAADARPVLPDGLIASGAHVDDVEAYRTVLESRGAEAMRGRVGRGEVDAITFTSSSTVRGWVRSVGAEIGKAVVATIGPITSETARTCGLPVQIEATPHTIPGLVHALTQYFGAERGRVEGTWPRGGGAV